MKRMTVVYEVPDDWTLESFGAAFDEFHNALLPPGVAVVDVWPDDLVERDDEEAEDA